MSSVAAAPESLALSSSNTTVLSKLTTLLPDLLCHIVSFLSTLELVEAEKISRSWRREVGQCWKLLPQLRDSRSISPSVAAAAAGHGFLSPCAYLLSFKKRSDIITEREHILRATTGTIKHNTVGSGIFIFGGIFNSNSSGFVRLEDDSRSIQHKPWKQNGEVVQLNDLEMGAFATAISRSGKLLMIGGWVETDEAEVEDHATNCMVQVSLMEASPPLSMTEMDEIDGDDATTFGKELANPTCFAAATTTIDGHVVLTGGGESPYRGSLVYDSCSVQYYKDDESYQTEQWSPLPPMQTKRCGHSCVALYDDSVAVFGGYAGGTKYLNSAERFEWGAGRWVSLPGMNHPRSGGGAGLGPDGCLYMAGGSPDGCRGHKTFERLDVRTKGWDLLAPMAHGRGYTAGTWGRDGLFYVCGGTDKRLANPLNESTVTQPTMECYDYRMGRWRRVDPPPAHPLFDGEVPFDTELFSRSGHAMVFVL